MTSPNRLNRLLSRVFQTALPASAATTAAVALCGHADEGNAIAPLNAVSHIPWGDAATEQESVSLKYTASGIALNALAVASWSLVYELAFGRLARRGNIPVAVLGGASVAALAYVTDYYVVPKRLTPGFEKRLSRSSMLAVYATLALTLPVACVLDRYRK